MTGQLFRCIRLSANITHAACVRNQARIESCKGCDGLEKESEDMGREVVCRSCGKKAPNAGRDLCAACYRTHRKNGTLEQFPMQWDEAAPAPAGSEAAGVEPAEAEVGRCVEGTIGPLSRLLTPAAPTLPSPCVVLDLSGEPGLADALASNNIGEPEIIELLGYLVKGELQRLDKAAA